MRAISWAALRKLLGLRESAYVDSLGETYGRILVQVPRLGQPATHLPSCDVRAARIVQRVFSACLMLRRAEHPQRQRCGKREALMVTATGQAERAPPKTSSDYKPKWNGGLKSRSGGWVSSL